MSHSKSHARTSRKRNREKRPKEEPQTSQVLSFHKIRLYFDKKFADVKDKLATETEHHLQRKVLLES